MSIRIGTPLDNSACLAMANSRQFHELTFRSRIYVHKMMPTAVPTFSHSLSSCLRLIRRFRSRFADFPSRFLQRRLRTFRGFRYFVPCPILADPLICGRVPVPVATPRQAEQKNKSENHCLVFSHTVTRELQTSLYEFF